MSSRLRSTNGCWTCRLRRKKCDEIRPHCRRCSKLQLECDGYTEKPIWMDGSELQKLKIEQTKRLIRVNKGSGYKKRATLLTDPYNFPNPNKENYDVLFRSQYLNTSASNSSASSSKSNQTQPFHRPPTSEEANLLLRYLEITCETQFLMAGKANRGMLYLAITRSDITYWATLSLASYYHGSNSMTCFYNNLAILELRKNILLIEFKQSKPPDMILECCFCMTQLIFLEKLRGNLEACKMHMNAACNLLTNFQIPATSNGALQLLLLTPSADNINSAMLSLVITTLRWFDVLLCCSLRTLPSISAPLLDILRSQSNAAQMADKITLQGQVAENLAQVLELDNWKTSVAKAGRLSVIELVKRATRIENSILSSQNITKIARSESQPSSECVTGNILVFCMAQIFTSTATVYLQVIIAGSHREVPEISRGVSHTVSLFRDLPGDETLSYLAWPFCFIGCLATGNDREFIANLATKALLKTNCTLNVKWAWTIIKECWRLLDEENFVDPDWLTAMKTLKFQFIPF
ncbi:fungal-specific transcription factor domain-containing protein [Xylogone sp. PMI_703]|nr:fungal-specific transcription factor domain-containing protein [Xylogone sp. PMI_703]